MAARHLEQPFLLRVFLLFFLLPLRSYAMFNNVMDSLVMLWACTEETPFLVGPAVTCSQYVICMAGVTSVHDCPPGQVFKRHALVCDWPTRDEVKGCYKNLDVYTRAACPRNSAFRLPVPDSCAMYIDCSKAVAPEVQDNHVLECPYPSLFSVTTRTCVDFRQGEQLCHGRPVPKSPCDYLQYKQISPEPAQCLQRHPSCVGKPDGALTAKMFSTSGLFVMCYRERTVNAFSCVKDKNANSVGDKNQGISCNRLVH